MGIRTTPIDRPDNEVSLFVSQNAPIRGVMELARQVADTDATVLVTGECGTGKEMIARFLHANSSRHESAFVAVNCGAIPEALQESELFGHVPGAFTGAFSRRVGKFEAADRGTIFLDEVGEMSKAFQVKLLRILQSGEYAPLGAGQNQYCDVRVVAATNRDVDRLVESGEFRRDLFYRLNIIHLQLPPLRERRSDIPLLAEHFLKRYVAKYSKPKLSLDEDVNNRLALYDYPGNVRELENIIHRAVILCDGRRISLVHLPKELISNRSAATTMPTRFHEAKGLVIEDFERAYLKAMLDVCGGIVSRAAKRSGLSERGFHEKLKTYGINSWSFRG